MLNKRLVPATLLALGIGITSCATQKPASPPLAPATAPDLHRASERAAASHDYVTTISKLRELVATFPEDTLASQAQYQIGDIFMNQARDFAQASKEFELVVARYSETRWAVNAQFMLGFISANYLQDLGRAKAEYERFLELFSARADSGLVLSAKFELEYLGKNLEDIPHLNQTSP